MKNKYCLFTKCCGQLINFFWLGTNGQQNYLTAGGNIISLCDNCDLYGTVLIRYKPHVGGGCNIVLKQLRFLGFDKTETKRNEIENI